MSANSYRVGEHLVDRLVELGVDHAIAVPGDHARALLDRVVAHPRVGWTGCSDELNAGYAAEGYGRLRGIAALFTTHGAGELRATDAVAACYTEHVPVVHVVSAPTLVARAARRLVNHASGDEDIGRFVAIHADITCARAVLTPGNATAEIDRVLTTVRDQHLPGYLLIPADVVDASAEKALAPLS